MVNHDHPCATWCATRRCPTRPAPVSRAGTQAGLNGSPSNVIQSSLGMGGADWDDITQAHAESFAPEAFEPESRDDAA